MYSFTPPSPSGLPYAALHQSRLMRFFLWIFGSFMALTFMLVGVVMFVEIPGGGPLIALGFICIVFGLLLLISQPRQPQSVLFDDGVREIKLFKRRVRAPRDALTPDLRVPYEVISAVDITRRVSTSTSNGRTSRTVHWDVHLTKQDGARWVFASLTSKPGALRLLEQLKANTRLPITLPPSFLPPTVEIDALLARAEARAQSGGASDDARDDDTLLGALSATSALKVAREGERSVITWSDEFTSARARRALFAMGWICVTIGCALVGELASTLSALLFGVIAYAALRVALRGGSPGRVEVGPEGVLVYPPAPVFSRAAQPIRFPHSELVAVRVSNDLSGEIGLWGREHLEAQRRVMSLAARDPHDPTQRGARGGLFATLSGTLADGRLLTKIVKIDTTALHLCDVWALEGLIEQGARRFGAIAR